MDLLGKYKQDRPVAFEGAQVGVGTSAEYGFLGELVVKLSGGRINDSRQIMLTLLVLAAVFFAASLYLFLGGGSSPSTSGIPRAPVAGLPPE